MNIMQKTCEVTNKIRDMIYEFWKNRNKSSIDSVEFARGNIFFISNQMNLGWEKKEWMNILAGSAYTMEFASKPAFNCNLYTIFYVCIDS